MLFYSHFFRILLVLYIAINLGAVVRLVDITSLDSLPRVILVVIVCDNHHDLFIPLSALAVVVIVSFQTCIRFYAILDNADIVVCYYN